MQQIQVRSLGREDTLEEEMASHSGILAWDIPWTEEPDGLQSMGLQNSQTQLSNETTILLIYSSLFLMWASKTHMNIWAFKIISLGLLASFLWLIIKAEFNFLLIICCGCFSVAKACPTLQPRELQHAKLLCPPLPQIRCCDLSFFF